MKKLTLIPILIGLFFATGVQAALSPFQTYNGNVAVSTDGFGSAGNSGIISASVLAGATVKAAYLYSATNFTTGTPGVTLNGSAVTFGPRVANATACCNLASHRADVTSIVKSVIDGGAGGIYNFNIVETSQGSNADGEALVVVYEHASLPDATVAILDGFASVLGDTAAINFAAPLAPNEAGFFAEMALGIGFSCCNQKSTVMVNGQLLTTNAGNFDDGNARIDGSLITVGGFDDPFSPINPSYTQDHERYDLASFVNDGDTSIVVNTSNPSRDDNIFLSTFYVSGLAAVNEPPPSTNNVPEPAILGLLGISLLGLRLGRQRKA